VVRLPTGGPAAGAKVYVARPRQRVEGGDEDEQYSIEFDREADAVADDEGSFTLPPQTPGKYEIRAEADGQIPASKEVDLTRPVAAEIDLRFPASGTIEGTVVDDAGRPAPSAEIVVYRPDGTSFRQTADDQGRFRMGAQPLGPVIVRWASLRTRNQMRAPDPDDADRWKTFYDALRREGGEATVREGDVTKVEVRMPRLTRWTGRLAEVPGEHTGRWRGFYLQLDGASGQFVRVGDDGKFSVLLEPGAYTVWTNDGADWTSTPRVIPADRDVEADVGR
jgi:hypothetical protein